MHLFDHEYFDGNIFLNKCSFYKNPEELRISQKRKLYELKNYLKLVKIGKSIRHFSSKVVINPCIFPKTPTSQTLLSLPVTTFRV